VKLLGSLNPGGSQNPNFNSVLLPFDLSRGGGLFLFHGQTDVKLLSMYIQDSITKGNWAVNVGLRSDFYNGLRQEFPETAETFFLQNCSASFSPGNAVPRNGSKEVEPNRHSNLTQLLQIRDNERSLRVLVCPHSRDISRSAAVQQGDYEMRSSQHSRRFLHQRRTLLPTFNPCLNACAKGFCVLMEVL
jgi:hypothetical protein